MDRQEEVLRQFGRQLTRLREQQQLSLSGLADSSGLDIRLIGEIEAGQVDLQVTTILALARGLGLPPDQLLRYT